jgi:hypothetical protein
MSKAWPLAVFACLAATSALAAPPREWIGQGALPDLVVAFHDVGDGSMIVERIPPGETVEQWTQMVTTQRFAGVIARGGTLEEWHGYMTGGLARDCRNSRSSEPVRLTVAGKPAIEFRGDCPRNPGTGLPETYFIRAIAGTTDLHVAQVAFRRVPSAADAEWARAHLATVTLCKSGATETVCRAGPESFDR